MNRRVKHGLCTLCKRSVALTFHHLIPRKLHKRKRFAKRYSKVELNQGIMVCHRCHKGLHKLYSESDLGSRLNTEQAILADTAVIRHVAWVARQKS